MPKVIFRAVKIIDPQSEHHLRVVDLQIVSGIIQKIVSAGQLNIEEGDEVIDIEGACISPGWFDMHVHLNDPGYEWKENIHQLSSAAIQGGFTGILCEPNCSPTVDQSQMVHALYSRTASIPIDMHFSGAITRGTAGKELAEIYDMQQAGALAFTDGSHPLEHKGLILRALQYMQAFDGLMIHYPVDSNLAREGQMNEGIMATKLGMPGIPTLAESVALAGFLHLLDYSGGRVHLRPISTAESINLLKKISPTTKLTTGIDVAHFSMSDELLIGFDSNYKLMPPLRDEHQREVLCKAIGEGLIDVLSSGHQAQSIEDKQVEFANAEPGMIALQTFFAQINMHLIQKNIIDLSRFIELVSINPRRILKLPKITIQKGEQANLSIFHLDQEWLFNTHHLFSRSYNSPLLNHTLRGKVLGIYHKELLHLAID